MTGVLLDVNPAGTPPEPDLQPIQKSLQKSRIALKQSLTFEGEPL